MQKRLGLDLEVPHDFGIGLAWYVTGEGCFQASIHTKRMGGYKWLKLQFYIGIRADDKPGLDYIRGVLGIGKIYVTPALGGASPVARYEVNRIGDLYHVIVPLFEKYPLPKQWRKSRDFNMWKQLVHILHRQGKPRLRGGRLGSKPKPQSFWDEVEPLVKQLKESRIFSCPEATSGSVRKILCKGYPITK